MITKSRLLILFAFLSINGIAQTTFTITGDFPYLAGQTVRLIGFEGFGIYNIDSTKVPETGKFDLKYNVNNKGMGYLAAADNKAYFVVLDNENIQLIGEVLSAPESIFTLSGKENMLFVQYATEHPKREQALSAWVYLQKIYEADTLFATQKYPKQAIETEMLRIKQEDNDFLKSVDPKSYVSWFLPKRKLVSSVSTVAQYRTDEIPETLAAFRKFDYADERLYKSGLLKDAIESHFWLLENMGQPLDTVYNEMRISIDCLIQSLSQNEARFNEVTKYLFDLLERHSLLQASEYLAIKVLTQNSCTVNNDLAKQLESYRAMKKGNVAPDIAFTGDVLNNGLVIKAPNRLYDIQSDYKVVIFGASWCPKCAEELRQLLPLVEKWKTKGVEIVFISLDTDPVLYASFTKIFPFISMCDFKKWETKSVKDYYVFATPTIYLLDKELKILLRPNSIAQMDSWVNYLLK